MRAMPLASRTHLHRPDRVHFRQAGLVSSHYTYDGWHEQLKETLSQTLVWRCLQLLQAPEGFPVRGIDILHVLMLERICFLLHRHD